MTDQEPIYHFIRGQGWVIGEPLLTCYTASKRKVSIEFREPKRGERYRTVSPYSGKIDPVTSELDPVKIQNLVSQLYMADCYMYNKADVKYYRESGYKFFVIRSVKT